jgi:uncharacterized repeat protein (TIGR01451 family)
MVRIKQELPRIATGLRTHWVWLVALIFAALVVTAASRVTAAPLNQTVPPPTPPPPPTEVPQATATPRRDRDDDEQPAPPPPTPQAPIGEQPAQPPAQPQFTGDEPTATILAERLNVRSGPGTAFGVIGIAIEGETVLLLGRNADSSWFRICCATGTNTEGWISAPFIQLNVDPATLTAQVPLVTIDTDVSTPVEPAATAVTAEPTPATAAITESVTVPAAAAPVTPAEIELTIAQSPPYAQQGDEVTLTFVVTNLGTASATQVELRDEFPSELLFVEARAANDADILEEELDANRLALIITWPEVAGGASVSATVRVRISEDVENGAVIDNLAVISAAGGEPSTNGISIGMPPLALPIFQ